MKFLEAKDRPLNAVLSDNRFRIDAFQREYRWQRKHIEALISDLSTTFEKNYKEGDTIENYGDYGSYYMGPIVLCDDRKELSIVDGQQRLTSFTLLIIFLLHAQNELNLDDHLKVDLKKHLYVRRGGKDTLILNVDSRTSVIEYLIKSSATNFSIISGLGDYFSSNDSPVNESLQNIIERYEDITTLFPKELFTTIKLPIFIEWLLNNVILVEIKAFSMESAYTIFETMNDRGLSLSPTEILKGYLLSMIQDDLRSEEMNEFWKERISFLKSWAGPDSDLDFFRNWLRAKYAESQRLKTKGSENLDFEQIGTQFHSWFKSNAHRISLKRPEDYYYFIKSDFDFFSLVYIQIHLAKNTPVEAFEQVYVSSFYTIADSLSYPLFLAPISKIDDEKSRNTKILLVSTFIDCYVVSRTFQGRTITQSSIRNYIYDLVKEIRNLEAFPLKEILQSKLDDLSANASESFKSFQPMNNWGFYHYFFARIRYFVHKEDVLFYNLLRSKKQTSYILCPIFTESDNEKDVGIAEIQSVANYILIRRYHADEFNLLAERLKIDFLRKNGYLPEMEGQKKATTIGEFVRLRDKVLKEIVMRVWGFDNNF